MPYACPKSCSLTCKRRHLRCDEATPECGHCARSIHSCIYAALTPQSTSRDRGSSEALDGYAPQMPSPTPAGDCHEATRVSIVPSVSMQLQQSACDVAGQADVQALTPPSTAFCNWFDLLADDANVALQSCSEPYVQATNAALETSGSSDGMESVNGPALTAIMQSRATPCRSAQFSSLRLSRRPSPDVGVCDQWLGSQPEVLSEDARKLFHNFVTNISSWVSVPVRQHVSLSRMYAVAES